MWLDESWKSNESPEHIFASALPRQYELKRHFLLQYCFLGTDSYWHSQAENIIDECWCVVQKFQFLCWATWPSSCPNCTSASWHAHHHIFLLFPPESRRLVMISLFSLPFISLSSPLFNLRYEGCRQNWDRVHFEFVVSQHLISMPLSVSWRDSSKIVACLNVLSANDMPWVHPVGAI